MNKLRRSAHGSVAIAAAAALALSGCSGSGSKSSGTSGSSATSSATSGSGSASSAAGSKSVAKAGTLNLANTLNAPSTYNPWGPGYGINYSLWWSEALYDSLVTLDSKGKPQPSLATSWKENGASLTVNLRTGVQFTDGSAVDAAAVKANIDYAVAHPAGAECNAYLAGAKTTTGANSVTIVTPKPFPGLLTDLGQCAGFVVNPKALANDKTLTSAPAGSGPYTLDTGNTVAGQTYTFVRNPKYWNSKAFAYDKVVIKQYATTTAATNAVQSGQADLVANLVKSAVQGVGSSVTIAAGAPNFFQGIWFIDTKGKVAKPLGDVRVRQAMNYAVDRAAIVKSQFGDTGFVAGSTPFATYYQGYSKALADTYPHDVAKAKQLLTQAGYPNGFSAGIVAGPPTIQVAEAIAGQLAQVGIKLNISNYSSNFIAEMQSGKYPMVAGAYTLGSAQYQTIKGIVGPNGFWNPLHNSDPAVAALLDQIQTASASQATGLYAKLATTIAEKALLLCPVISTQLTAYNKKKVAPGSVPGIAVPMLYDIAPA